MKINKNDRFYYLVEGECEKKLIETFKEQKNIILPGKVTHFNVVQERITQAFLRTVSENTIMILVFDTDTDDILILNENIKLLKKQPNIKSVWCVTQVRNLEDELVRSTDVTEAKMLTGSKSNKEYKRDFIREKRLFEKLMVHHFDFSMLWITSPEGVFSEITNDGMKIKQSKTKSK